MIFNINIEYLLFFPIIIFIGLVTSYSDYKVGKIRNKTILLGLFYSFVINLLLFIYYFYIGEFYVLNLIHYVGNIIISVIFGYLLWHFKVWSAGDGKLFICFASLLPIAIYSKNFVPYFPALVLLLNIFIVGIIYMFLHVLAKEKWSDLFKTFFSSLKKSLSFDKLYKMLIKLFVVLVIIQEVFNFIDLGDKVLLKLIITLALFIPLAKLKFVYIIGLLVVILILWVFGFVSITKDFLILFGLSFLFVKGVRMLLFNYLQEISFQYFLKEINVDKLNEGDILADCFQKKIKMTKMEFKEAENNGVEILKPGNIYYLRKRKSNLFEKSLIDSESEGILKKDISKIKKMKFQQVRIFQSMPFAIVIFLGLVLTVIFRGFIV